MYAFLMTLFIILCFFLSLFILIQQGKGDLGLGSMSGSQMLFGGSGGQDFFEKATWIMGVIFMLGALGLAILKSKEVHSSILDGSKAPISAPAQAPVKQAPIQPLETAIPGQDEDSTPMSATPQEATPENPINKKEVAR
ncbi:MAG: preprotein translocase subunit SecG [Candidatus Babeliales bacterium]|jgi:protein translocase SecG subunit